MKNIDRRIRRLEEARFGTAADTEFSRRLFERIEEGRRRVAEAMGLGEWPGSVGNEDRQDLTGLNFTEIIQLERERLGSAKAERESEGDTRALPGATGCSDSLSTITTKNTRRCPNRRASIPANR